MATHARRPSTQVSVPKDRRALTRMRAALIQARDAGVEFEHAWTEALPAAIVDLPTHEARGWCEALRETKDAWRAGFERQQVLRLNGVAAD